MSTPVKGFATPAGTKSFALKHSAAANNDFYKVSASGLTLSSIGLGTYVGAASDEADEEYLGTLALAFESGINVVDTAIKYRAMRSEKVIGKALSEAISRQIIGREQLFISSKGGILCLPENEAPRDYIAREILSKHSVPSHRVTNDSHCIEPAFLRSELQRSLRNLNIETLDCYFIHNPETALFSYSNSDFYELLKRNFAMLEEEVAKGTIRTYGIASWKGFRAARNSQVFVDLERVAQIAGSLSGNNHFKFVELPLNVGMPYTYLPHSQHLASQSISAISLAEQLGLSVFTSGSVYEGRLAELYNLIDVARGTTEGSNQLEIESLPVSLPQSSTSLRQLFQLLWHLRQSGLDLRREVTKLSALSCDELYTSALDVVRSVPEVSCALVGCEKTQYLKDHLRLLTIRPCEANALKAFWNSLR